MEDGGWERRPRIGPRVSERVVRAADLELSGLWVEPVGPPRALVVAVHGAGVHAGYFDTCVAPGLSFLHTAADLGYAVWAPDRPGVGRTEHTCAGGLTLQEQADVLLAGTATVGAELERGVGVMLVGHSVGFKVALLMAGARSMGASPLGVDGAGTGLHLANERPQRSLGHRGPAFGPEDLYPPGVFDGGIPIAAFPAVRDGQKEAWPQLLRRVAPSLTMPIRITYGEHEGYWPIDEASLAELRRLLCHSSEVVIDIEPHTGHNVSLGWSARTYHLKALAFTERCILRRKMSAASAENAATRG